jgi:erythromycin esterase-like protein
MSVAIGLPRVPLSGADTDYDALLDRVGRARIVLLGEASHGTHEFYRERARITRRLIEEKAFTAVAVEADWPDAYRVNRYVRGTGELATEALEGFTRFPSWMWRNADVLDFVGWLREHDDATADQDAKVGFYGLDLYSLHTSIDAVLGYLDKVDPAAAVRARARYACFEQFGTDTEGYGWAAGVDADRSCEEPVVAQLVDLRRHAAEYAGRDGRVAPDELFYAEQNARLVRNAEAYYRAMFRGRAASWNLRDRHMADTLDALLAHLERPGRPARVVVWEHNSHVGYARATELAAHGELNVGQLARERHGDDVVSVGFTTYQGTVTAASEWGARAERKRVRRALPDSWESLLHALGEPAFLLVADGLAELRASRLERAIGVIYLPRTERASHYFVARLGEQFDVVIHIDETRAVEPLEPTSTWTDGEPPETYPTSL